MLSPGLGTCLGGRPMRAPVGAAFGGGGSACSPRSVDAAAVVVGAPRKKELIQGMRSNVRTALERLC